ncbi:hypothetical protein Poly24_34980 [Rosistilla carotiformis]|uniref:Uncharacterized protein n=1 Tax=Rosistilla carotiformis TaxID=2528017 RepID=A0A518JW70_9BACT|nr:hypothetical protein [Rosistilla carotiformis]QDV69781.1 hypothetical protein Poly24_34980 [Rosistilla carotiformis]
MTKGELTAPRIGALTILAAITTVVLQIVFGVWTRYYYGSAFGQAAWIGLMWLGCSMTASVCFSPIFSWRRVLIGVSGFGWHVLFMSVCWQEPPVRYLLLFGTLVGLQVCASLMLGVPVWLGFRTADEPVADGSLRYRFTIRSILLTTAMVAVLSSATRAYSITAAAAPLLAVPLFVLLYIGAASTMLATSYVRIRACCLLAVLLCGAILYSWLARALSSSVVDALTLREFILSLGSVPSDAFVVELQFLQFGLFAFSCCLWFALGRIDARDFERRRFLRGALAAKKTT